MKTKLKTFLSVALVAGAGASAWAEDAPEEEVVAYDVAEFWLGGDEIAVASGEGEFWLGPDEIAVASGEKTFWLGPEGLPVGESAWLVQTDGGWLIVGEGSATNLPSGFHRNSIKSVTVDDGITEIGARFFKKCYSLNTFTGGKNLASIGEKAFYLCASLESVVIENPNFDIEKGGLKEAIVYQTAIKEDGTLYTIPTVTIPGCAAVLYGTNDLTDPTSWTPVDPDKTMEASGYHFFKFVLKKIEE